MALSSGLARPDAHPLKTLFAQDGSRGWRGTEGEGALVMDEAVVRPHGPGKDGEAEMPAIRRKVGVIGGDNRQVEETSRRQSRRAKHNGIDKVDDVRVKFVQTADKQGTK